MVPVRRKTMFDRLARISRGSKLTCSEEVVTHPASAGALGSYVAGTVLAGIGMCSASCVLTETSGPWLTARGPMKPSATPPITSGAHIGLRARNAHATNGAAMKISDGNFSSEETV